MSERRFCPDHRRSSEIVEVSEEGTTERHPARYIVTRLACGHEFVEDAADQSDRSM